MRSGGREGEGSPEDGQYQHVESDSSCRRNEAEFSARGLAKERNFCKREDLRESVTMNNE